MDANEGSREPPIVAIAADTDRAGRFRPPAMLVVYPELKAQGA
jgi:hypothetical protein